MQGCPRPTYWWQKGFGPDGPWGAQVLFLDEGWLKGDTEFWIQNGEVAPYPVPRAWFDDEYRRGGYAMPAEITWCGLEVWVQGWEWWFEGCPHFSPQTNEMPNQRAPVIESIIALGSGGPGWEHPDWWVLDCRNLTNTCPPETAKVYIDVWLHEEPTPWDPEFGGEKYAFGRWRDPHSGEFQGLGLVGWYHPSEGWVYGRYVMNARPPTVICANCP